MMKLSSSMNHRQYRLLAATVNRALPFCVSSATSSNSVFTMRKFPCKMPVGRHQTSSRFTFDLQTGGSIKISDTSSNSVFTLRTFPSETPVHQHRNSSMFTFLITKQRGQLTNFNDELLPITIQIIVSENQNRRFPTCTYLYTL